jgi:hypothetical protein
MHAHANLLGENLNFQRLYPDTSTTFGPAFTQPTITVIEGGADNTSWVVNGITYVTAIPEADTITLEFFGGNYGGTYEFDGYGITGFSTPPTGVQVTSAGVSGYTVTFAQDALYVDLGSGCSFCTGTIVLDFTSPVPEPSVLGLLIAGLGPLAILARRRRAD